MHRHRHHHAHIYRSRRHLLATVFLLLLPLLALLASTAWSRAESGTFLLDVGLSSIRLAIAYAVAATLAWLFAVLFERGPLAVIALPLFDVLQSFPTFALLPLATIVFGHGNVTVVFFLIVTIIWPILFSVLSSLKLARQDWREAVHVAGLHGWQYIRLYLWPVTVPGLITGSVIGLGEGWEALVATEMLVGVRHGLGAFFQLQADHPAFTALGILALLFVIFGINKILWLPLLDWGHHSLEE